MFEVGFTEILLISILALVVLGPEKLPRVAAQLGRWMGRARTMARQAAEAGDDGTNDLLVSDVIRTNEKHGWFVSEHVVDVPLVRAE